MHTIRQQEIQKATQGQTWGLVLGSLGRQGSPKVLQVRFRSLTESEFIVCSRFFQTIKDRLKANGKKFVQVVMPELMPDKLKLFRHVNV